MREPDGFKWVKHVAGTGWREGREEGRMGSMIDVDGESTNSSRERE